MMRALLECATFLALVAIPGTRARSPSSGEVVSATWVSQHLKDSDLVILQISRPEDYARGHIPGSQSITPGDLEHRQADVGMDEMMATLPDEADLQHNLEAHGISDRSHVVVVFVGHGMPAATRAMFILRYAGVDDVSLLDGGMASWEEGHYPVTRVTPVVPPGRFTPHVASGLAVDYAYVQSHLHAAHFRIVDAREAVYYHAANSSSGMAAGHIPGAANLPFNSLFDDANMLRPIGALQASFQAAGVGPGDTVIAYCHVGIQATAVLLTARALGIPARLYVGSFHDWSARKLPTEGGQ